MTCDHMNRFGIARHWSKIWSVDLIGLTHGVVLAINHYCSTFVRIVVSPRALPDRRLSSYL